MSISLFFFVLFFFFFDGSVDHRYLPVLTHVFPPRRSPDRAVPLRISSRRARYRRARRGDRGAVRGPWRAARRRRAAIPARPSANRVGDPRHEQRRARRSEEHTSELQSLMRISYAVYCLQKKTSYTRHKTTTHQTRLN